MVYTSIDCDGTIGHLSIVHENSLKRDVPSKTLLSNLKIFYRSTDDFSFEYILKKQIQRRKISFSVYLSDECTHTHKTAPTSILGIQDYFSYSAE